MRCSVAVSTFLLAGVLAGTSALAQGDQRITPAGRTVAATGQTMPPAPGLSQSRISPSSQDQMLKAQRAARNRDKAWDAKMNKTMGSICKGC